MTDLTINSILVADDDLDEIMILLSIINDFSKDLNISHVSDGAELLRFLASNEKPELILLDINMPKIDGVDCLQRINSSNKFNDIPIIMYSTSNNQDVIDKCYQLGASRYVVKPFKYEDIIRFMKIILTINWKESKVVPHGKFVLSSY